MFSTWDHDFLWLAAQWGQRKSKDPSTRVGALVAQGNKIVSLGYNGFPPRIADDLNLLNDREAKLERMVHAEINAILFADGHQRGGTLYTSPFPPCHHCAPVIIAAGIARVVSPPSIPRWAESTDKAARLFHQAGIEQWIVDNGMPRQVQAPPPPDSDGAMQPEPWQGPPVGGAAVLG